MVVPLMYPVFRHTAPEPLACVSVNLDELVGGVETEGRRSAGVILLSEPEFHAMHESVHPKRDSDGADVDKR